MASYPVTGVRHPGTPCIIRRREIHGPQRGAALIPVPYGCTPDEAHAISPSSGAPAAVINPLHGGLLASIKGPRGRAAQCETSPLATPGNGAAHPGRSQQRRAYAPPRRGSLFGTCPTTRGVSPGHRQHGATVAMPPALSYCPPWLPRCCERSRGMQTRAQSSLEAFVDFLYSIVMNVGGQRVLYGAVATVGRITFFSSIF